LRSNGVKAIFLGGSSLYVDPEFKFKNEDVGTGLRLIGLPSLKEINPAMAVEYKTEIGSDPGIYTIPSIDATNVFLRGIASGATTRSQLHFFINNYKEPGVLGNEISFDLFGDFKGNSFVGYEYINDAFRLLIRNF
jgi:ABC-type branched-subunit amino acid transport system substrate-binding protein